MSRIAFVFPGQGSQHAGMGRDLAEAYPESRAVFDRADAALGVDLSRTCFEGPDEALALTETTQPAVLTVSVAALAALEARGVRAEAAAGHSLGEYSAHVAAGTLAFDDAVRAVRARGRFMQEAVPVGEGAMAAILGLEPAAVEGVCRDAAENETVRPANLNGPGQVVVAGHAAAVGRAVKIAEASGARKAMPLPVSAPFHCELMRPAAEALAPVLERIAFGDPRFPVYANADATAVTLADAARAKLVEQVTAPVRWHDLVLAMAADGVDTMVEVGPGRVLSGLVRRIDRNIRVLSVSDPAGVEKAVETLVDGGKA